MKSIRAKLYLFIFSILGSGFLFGYLAYQHNQKLEKIQKDTDRDFYMTAQEAIDYGLADKIVDKI